MSEQQSPAQRPIGYWLKRLDRAIDARFDEQIASFGLTRRHWQVLHTVAKAPIAADEMEAVLAPFWSPGTVTWQETVDTLTERHLIRDEDGALHITASGDALHTELFARVGDTRHRLLDGIPDDDYLKVIQTLARMTENAERPTS